MTRKKRDPLVVLGKNVQRFRHHRRLKVKALAELASLDRKTIFLIEQGKHSPNVATLTLIADALETETWMLLVDPRSWSPSSKFEANLRFVLGRTSAPLRETFARLLRALRPTRNPAT